MSWYIRDGLKPRGPFEKAQVERLLRHGALSPEDWLCEGAQSEWKAAREFPEFSRLPFPSEQAIALHDTQAPVWVVLSIRDEEKHQEGPMSMDQVRDGLLKGRFALSDHMWCDGMTGWARIESRPEFRDLARLISPAL